eukprot:m.445872 g.445872  ORF g.445872 m.445872 type:complete len:182 (+) comp56860_c0_seq1:94-639(+)
MDNMDEEGNLRVEVDMVGAGQIALTSLAMALLSVLGTTPLLMLESITTLWSSMASAAAGGLMISSSFLLIYEAQQFQSSLLVLGLILGLSASRFVARTLALSPSPSNAAVHSASATDLVANLGTRTMLASVLHVVIEGSGVGSLFAVSHPDGMLIAFAIGIHNIPECLTSCHRFLSAGLPP